MCVCGSRCSAVAELHYWKISHLITMLSFSALFAFVVGVAKCKCCECVCIGEMFRSFHWLRSLKLVQENEQIICSFCSLGLGHGSQTRRATWLASFCFLVAFLRSKLMYNADTCYLNAGIMDELQVEWIHLLWKIVWRAFKQHNAPPVGGSEAERAAANWDYAFIYSSEDIHRLTDTTQSTSTKINNI